MNLTLKIVHKTKKTYKLITPGMTRPVNKVHYDLGENILRHFTIIIVNSI